LQFSGQSKAYSVLRRPHHNLFALLLRRGRDEKGDEDALGVLHPGCEVDQHLVARCHLLLLFFP
jgi:hypothetical protein